MSFVDKYVDYWDANLRGIPYQYEPLLMREDQLEQAMREAKLLSWLIFNETKKLHKKSAKQNKITKIINIDADFRGGALNISCKVRLISTLSEKEKDRHIERIKSYKNNHPEKCYLSKLTQ